VTGFSSPARWNQNEARLLIGAVCLAHFPSAERDWLFPSPSRTVAIHLSPEYTAIFASVSPVVSEVSTSLPSVEMSEMVRSS